MFHIIMSPKFPVIIDWIDASVGDFKADVCKTYIIYSEINKELAEIHFDMYCMMSGVKKEDILKWEPIIAGARLSKNIACKQVSIKMIEEKRKK